MTLAYMILISRLTVGLVSGQNLTSASPQDVRATGNFIQTATSEMPSGFYGAQPVYGPVDKALQIGLSPVRLLSPGHALLVNVYVRSLGPVTVDRWALEGDIQHAFRVTDEHGLVVPAVASIAMSFSTNTKTGQVDPPRFALVTPQHPLILGTYTLSSKAFSGGRYSAALDVKARLNTGDAVRLLSAPINLNI